MIVNIFSIICLFVIFLSLFIAGMIKLLYMASFKEKIFDVIISMVFSYIGMLFILLVWYLFC